MTSPAHSPARVPDDEALASVPSGPDDTFWAVLIIPAQVVGPGGTRVRMIAHGVTRQHADEIAAVERDYARPSDEVQVVMLATTTYGRSV